jgi:hypothetical protein
MNCGPTNNDTRSREEGRRSYEDCHPIDTKIVEGWKNVEQHPPALGRLCDWLLSKSFLKGKLWILDNVNCLTASVLGGATHWCEPQSLPASY